MNFQVDLYCTGCHVFEAVAVEPDDFERPCFESGTRTRAHQRLGRSGFDWPFPPSRGFPFVWDCVHNFKYSTCSTQAQEKRHQRHDRFADATESSWKVAVQRRRQIY